MWRTIQKFLAAFVPALLLAVYVGIMICLLNRWDSMVPITLIPVWAWGAAGALVSLLGWLVFRGKAILFVFCLWLVSGIAFAEETHGIVRELVASMNEKPKSDFEEKPDAPMLRIVNLNAAKLPDALANLSELEPDIIAIQGAPPEENLTVVAKDLFGDERALVMNGTNAILARGEFLQTLAEPESDTVHARLRTPRGTIVDITNLQLDPCLPRLDMWKPSVWEALTATRLQNRKLVRAFLGENELASGRTGRVVCGGFETPPGDDVFRPLETTGLIDSFGAAGMGWGNTYPSDYAVFRLDQIWVSDNLPPKRVTTRLNEKSNHRTVVCEVEVMKP